MKPKHNFNTRPNDGIEYDKLLLDYLGYQSGRLNTPAYTEDGYLFLGGYVERIEYHVLTRTGKAYLYHGHCTDCPSVVRFFQQIDPHVRRIETFSGKRKDTTYLIREDGTIKAYLGDF